MAWSTDRIIVFDRSMSFVCEIAPDEVLKRERTEELNGTHELELVTSRVLHEGHRLLTVDNTGRWREHVVYKPDEAHEKGKHATGTYVCMWSLQYDLTTVGEGNVAQPGMGASCTSANAVRAAIGGQSIWGVNTSSCDVPAVAAGKGCVMVGNNAWNRLKQVVKAWGGEVDAEITVSSTRVVTRNVVLRAHLGSTKVTRRFDWGEDLTSIHRTPDPGPYYCRIIPLGRGQKEYAEDDETEFDWPLDISEETGGRIYIEDAEAAAVFRTSDGHGGWHYPTKIVKYDEDDPELLLNAGTEDLPNHTRPGVSYEADVLQFAEAGMDVQGVQLGDETQCVDYGFNPDAALRVQGRVTRMVVNELAPKTETKLTLGSLGTSLATTLIDLISSNTQGITSRVNHIEGAGTIVYLEQLLDQLNAEINVTGGYAYIVQDEGFIVYDIAVDDPLVGYNSATHTWASKVVQIKGGNIRIANEKNASFEGINDWKWKTMLVSGHIAAELVTAAQIVAGYIGSSGDTFIDLDHHTVQLGQTSGPHVVVDSTGMQVYNESTSLGFFGYESNVGIVRVGQANNAHVKISSNGSIEMKTEGGASFAYFGRGNVNDYSTTGHKLSVYYTLGVRATQAAAQAVRNIISSRYSYMVGDCSFSAGDNNIAAGDSSVALGYQSYAVGHRSFAACGGYAIDDWSIAIGGEAYGENSICIGHSSSIASDASGLAMYGGKLRSGALRSVAIGYNSNVYYKDTTVIGNGIGTISSSVRFAVGVGYKSDGGSYYNYTGLTIDDSGNMQIRGEYRTSSDRRLKKHHAYLGDDAVDFVRKLKPALFTKDGKRHVGFYAQDVQAAEPEEWGTETVSEVNYEYRDGIDYSPLTLDYNALIAPLVAYAQGLERRIDQQQKQIDMLTERLEKLEGAR